MRNEIPRIISRLRILFLEKGVVVAKEFFASIFSSLGQTSRRRTRLGFGPKTLLERESRRRSRQTISADRRQTLRLFYQGRRWEQRACVHICTAYRSAINLLGLALLSNLEKGKLRQASSYRPFFALTSRERRVDSPFIRANACAKTEIFSPSND